MHTLWSSTHVLCSLLNSTPTFALHINCLSHSSHACCLIGRHAFPWQHWKAVLSNPWLRGHMATTSDSSCNSYTFEAFSAVFARLVFALVPPVCLPICPFTCQSLMSDLNTATLFLQYVGSEMCWFFPVSYWNVPNFPVFSWSPLPLLIFADSLFLLFIFISLSLCLSVLCWGLCEPQMPLQHLLLPLRRLHLQLKAGLPLHLPQPPTLELVGDQESVHTCVCLSEWAEPSHVSRYHCELRMCCT